jgi:hypothetical protein
LAIGIGPAVLEAVFERKIASGSGRLRLIFKAVIMLCNQEMEKFFEHDFDQHPVMRSGNRPEISNAENK